MNEVQPAGTPRLGLLFYVILSRAPKMGQLQRTDISDKRRSIDTRQLFINPSSINLRESDQMMYGVAQW